MRTLELSTVRFGKYRELALAILVIFFMISCDRFMPSYFWTNFRSDLIVKQYSDQGPWGGDRVIHWAADHESTFDETIVRLFAKENGWTFVSRSEVGEDELNSWTDRYGRTVVPLTFNLNNGHVASHDRMITSDAIVLKFETGWNREDPGTNEMTPAYGYVLVQKDGKKMAVYHFWGNG